MSFSNPFMCRGIASGLLHDNNKPSDKTIGNRIQSAEAKINIWLAPDYVTPIRPKLYLTGTITVNKDSKNIEGSGTVFTNLMPRQVIQIVKTGEVFQIDTINSDTSITADSDILTNAVDSQFWVVPDELVTASAWLGTHLTIMTEFPEHTLKQDNVEKFDRRMEAFAGSILKLLEGGDYKNFDLVPQTNENGAGRLVYIGIDNINRERIDRNHITIHKRSFK